MNSFVESCELCKYEHYECYDEPCSNCIHNAVNHFEKKEDVFDDIIRIIEDEIIDKNENKRDSLLYIRKRVEEMKHDPKYK